MYCAGNNITKIQNQLKINRNVIKRTLQEFQLPIKTKSEIIQDTIPELKDKQYLLELYEVQCCSIADIAKKLQTNEQVVKTAFKRFKIKTTNARNKKLIKAIPELNDKKYLHTEYIVNNRSPAQIAKRLKCSSTAVENALRRHKIKTRTHSEAAKLYRATPEQQLNSKIARNLRSRFWIALFGKSKMASAVADLGMSIPEFKHYIANMFYESPSGEPMTWDNYGQWEIDHIRPLSDFDLTSKDQQAEACHYTNLQPLWRSENRAKSNNVIIGAQPKKVPFYLVTGPAGVGKSWVCDQLQGVNYISYDLVPKEQHYHYMVELSKNGKPIVYDPFRKATTIYNRYRHLFDIKIIVINETVDVVKQRLEQRGSKMSREDVAKYVKKFNNTKLFDFSGTSSEVLEFLTKELNNSTFRTINNDK